jgi:hypothetical protein
VIVLNAQGVLEQIAKLPTPLQVGDTVLLISDDLWIYATAQRGRHGHFEATSDWKPRSDPPPS